MEKKVEGVEVATSSSGATPGISRWLVPFLIVFLTFAAFLPALQNEFVNWDDDQMLLDNPQYRGFGWQQIRWMFSTFHMGHYQPLSWVTFGLDYLLWGMDPFGYHLTNLLFHAANAVLFYFITLRLLALALPSPSGAEEFPRRLAAGFASLLFAIHPLRVESAAWATERRDVLSGLFFLIAILCYLRYTAVLESVGWLRWILASVFAYALSLLSKAGGITLPVILLVLDVYPLRRLKGGFKEWFRPASHHVWWEKVPFLSLALAFGIIALLAQYKAEAMRPFAEYGTVSRLAQALLGLCFYLLKTLVPFSLSPLYALPDQIKPWDWLFLSSGIVVLTVSIGLFALRGRWPAGLAIWISYIVILAPVLGIAQSGPQIVADRYTYLSCLGWVILAGAGVLYYWQQWGRDRISLPTFILVHGLAAAILIGLGLLTWGQVQVWRNSETLWRYTLSIGYESSIAHNGLGFALGNRGDLDTAIKHFRRALQMNPRNVDAHFNLGNALASRNELEEAIAHYRRALQVNPTFAEAYYVLGNTLADGGEFDEAITHYRRALQINPADAKTHYALGNALTQREGKLEEAIKHYREAVRINPTFAEAHNNLGFVLAERGNLDEAVEHYREALRLNPTDAKAHFNLGFALVHQGNLEEAIGHFRKVVSLEPDFAEAHVSLGKALALQGNSDEAIKHYQEALRLAKSRPKTRARR